MGVRNLTGAVLGGHAIGRWGDSVWEGRGRRIVVRACMFVLLVYH